MLTTTEEATTARKFTDKISGPTIQADLEKYREMAIALGAIDAKTIKGDAVIVDERVYAKCMYPKCRHYGTCANCPPYTIPADEARKIFSRYNWGLLVRLEVSPDVIAGQQARKTGSYVAASLKRTEIVSKIEAQAFDDGYHLAIAFGGGPCKAYLCPTTECNVLKGKGCRHPLKARPAMEAVGLDVFTMAENAGWNMYPIGENTNPSKVPFGSFIGLVLIK